MDTTHKSQVQNFLLTHLYLVWRCCSGAMHRTRLITNIKLLLLIRHRCTSEFLLQFAEFSVLSNENVTPTYPSVVKNLNCSIICIESDSFHYWKWNLKFQSSAEAFVPHSWDYYNPCPPRQVEWFSITIIWERFEHNFFYWMKEFNRILRAKYKFRAWLDIHHLRHHLQPMECGYIDRIAMNEESSVAFKFALCRGFPTFQRSKVISEQLSASLV